MSTFVLNVLKIIKYRSQVPVSGQYQRYFKVLAPEWLTIPVTDTQSKE